MLGLLGRDETALVERSPRLTSALGFNDQLPINAVAGKVGSGTKMSGNATLQEIVPPVRSRARKGGHIVQV